MFYILLIEQGFYRKKSLVRVPAQKTRRGYFESRSFEEYFLLEQKELFDEYN